MAKFKFGVKGVPDKFTIFVLVSFVALGVSALLDFSTAAVGINLEYLLTYELSKALAAITLIFAARLLIRILVKGILYESLRSGRISTIIAEPQRVMKYAVAEVISMVVFVLLAAILVTMAIGMGKILPEALVQQGLGLMTITSWYYVSPLIFGLLLVASWAITWYLYEKTR